MCAFYDGAVVAAVSTLCWVAKNEACSVKPARMALLWHSFCQCLAVFVSLLPRACLPSSSRATSLQVLSEPQTPASQSSVLVCFG